VAQRKSKNRPSGKRTGGHHRRRPKSPAPAITGQPAPPRVPSLISDSLRDFAKGLKHDTLKYSDSILKPGTLKYSDSVKHDRHIEEKASMDILAAKWLVKAVLEADEDEALVTLASVLEGWPDLLWHPVVQNQFDYLFCTCGYWTAPQEFRDRVNGVLSTLIAAWARGMTGGYEVSIRKPKGHRGQTPSLFPYLGERDGYMVSQKALEDYRYAQMFRNNYDDLMGRLKRAVEWRRVRREYQEFLQNQRDPTPVVEEVAANIRDAFESFARDQRISGEPLSNQTLRKIVEEGLAVRRGGDPRHKIACGLLGRVELVIRGTVLRTSLSLIESTLKTLRKHGIGGRSRPSRSQSAKRKLRRFSL